MFGTMENIVQVFMFMVTQHIYGLHSITDSDLTPSCRKMM